MSTFVVSLAVVGAAVVGVVVIALADPDQPATNRSASRRDGRHRRRRVAAHRGPPAPASTPSPSPGAEHFGSGPAHRRTARGRPLAGTSVVEAPVPVLPAPGRRDRVRRRSTPGVRRAVSGWRRLRSGVALVVLVTFVGLVLAALVGTTLALAAEALRHAVG